jgi:thioredoxin-related protein
VDGLERDLEGEAQVLRLSVLDDVGGQLAMRYGVRGVPTFVLLDGAGDVVLMQGGMPDRESIQVTVAGLLEKQ